MSSFTTFSILLFHFLRFSKPCCSNLCMSLLPKYPSNLNGWSPFFYFRETFLFSRCSFTCSLLQIAVSSLNILVHRESHQTSCYSDHHHSIPVPYFCHFRLPDTNHNSYLWTLSHAFSTGHNAAPSDFLCFSPEASSRPTWHLRFSSMTWNHTFVWKCSQLT